MNRIDVIQAILNRRRDPVYLEIGVGKGESFFPIRAHEKIAVDPCPRISTIRRAVWRLSNPSNRAARYCHETSDDYFANPGNSSRPDVVFIDGLHTREQSLMDVNNALRCLKDDGVIALHDCNPPHAAAAQPAESYEQAASLYPPGWTGEWCGEVWKTIVGLRAGRDDLNVFVLDCDYGIGIVSRGRPDDTLDLASPVIDRMTYDDLSRNRKMLLNLRDESYLPEFLNAR